LKGVKYGLFQLTIPAFTWKFLNKKAFTVGIAKMIRVLSYYIQLTNSKDRVCLGKLKGSQLVKKFPAFYGTQTELATCPYPQPNQSSPCPPHPNSWRSILISASHLCLVLPSAFSPSCFLTKTLYAPLLSPIHVCYMSCPPNSC